MIYDKNSKQMVSPHYSHFHWLQTKQSYHVLHYIFIMYHIEILSYVQYYFLKKKSIFFGKKKPCATIRQVQKWCPQPTCPLLLVADVLVVVRPVCVLCVLCV